MDFVRLLGCAIGLFSTTLVLYFVLYYYPRPFRKTKIYENRRSNDIQKFAERFQPGFRQRKVPVAERLHKAQRKRIFGQEMVTDDSLDVPRHRGRAGIKDWEGERKDKGDHLDEARTLDSNRLNQAQTQDSESWKQISNANRLHANYRLDRLQMLDDRLNEMKRPYDHSRDLKMQDVENIIKKESPDPNRIQEVNNQDPENLLGIKTPNDEKLQMVKTLYNEISRGLNPHTLLDPAQEQLLEQAIHKLYNEIQNPETNGLNLEKEELAKDLGAKNLHMQKYRLLGKDWEAMRDRLVAVRKDRLNLTTDELETPNVPSRPVPEESFHGTEHMLGR